ncbi:Protein O-mannosyltransferase 2, partial [Coemansia sp. BCRC 34490]
HANYERFLLVILTLFAFAIRTYKIGNDSRVVWDETHFGRFASNYINRRFYLDVHPPLGKLLITLVFWLSGYSGSFDFASGEHYPASVPYVQVRCFQAAVGSLLAPSTFYLCRTLGFPLGAAWVAAILVVVDNALIGISRIIVLDPMLLLANSLLVIAFSRVLSASSGRPASVLLRFVWLGILAAVVCR